MEEIFASKIVSSKKWKDKECLASAALLSHFESASQRPFVEKKVLDRLKTKQLEKKEAFFTFFLQIFVHVNGKVM